MGRYFTPLRYPGGKQKLAPFVEEIMVANGLLKCDYSEPFAGGGGVALSLLFRDKVGHIHLNDKSYPVFCFWRSVLEEGERFCRLISGATLSVDEWRRQRQIISDPGASFLDVGFSVFYLNRCNRSGILTGGLIGGLAQAGTWKMDARFSRNELIRRVELIAGLKERISIHNLDAEDYITGHLNSLKSKCLVYCDPPYFNKADRLYLNHYHASDHCSLASVIQTTLRHPWLVSYDAVEDVIQLYLRRTGISYSLQYNVSTVYKGSELMYISDDLSFPSSSTLKSLNEALKAG